MCGKVATCNNKSVFRRLFGACLGVAVAVTGLYTGTVSAQGIVLDEIIITAQKREQALEDVPVSVSAVTGETVRDLLGSAENVRALANRVPSLNIESSNGRTQPRFYIRGMGNIDFDNNAAQPVGMVFDEIFLESNVLRSLPLFDIERVEVLKGPQGTLFGRNTNAGLVKIDSVKPSLDGSSGYISGAFGDRNTFVGEFATGGPLADNMAGRVSIKYQRRSDWIDNVANGPGDDYGEFEEFAWRIQLLFDSDGPFRGLIKMHSFSQDGTQPQVFYANGLEQGKKGLRKGFDVTKANHDSGAGMTLDHVGGAINLAWDLGDYTFTSITGVDSIENFQFTDVDGGICCGAAGDIGVSLFPVATGDGLDEHSQVTQEFRYSAENDNVFFQGGVYILDDNSDIKTFDFFSGAEDIVRQQTDSFAVFGQAEFSPNDRFSVTAGLRYTWDEKDLEVRPGPASPSPPGRISVNDDFWSWDLAFMYDMNDDWAVYGRLANASRGPVTLGRFGFTSSAKTETADSIELGFKAGFMDGRARWNAAIYSFRVDDQQLTATGGGANINRLLNADAVNGSGFETDFEILLTDELLLIANASYNDTEIDDSDLEEEACGSAPLCTVLDPILVPGGGAFGGDLVSIDGNPLPRTPEWMYNVILQYAVPVADGEFYFHTDWNYRDDSNLFLHESIEFVAESRWLGGVRTGYRSDSGIDVALVGCNVTNEITVDGGINFNNLTVFVNEPRFWGVEFRKSWD